MERLKIYEIFNCNKTLNKMFEQQNTFPISIGFKLFKIMKMFDEVEEYVFNIMEITFKDFKFEHMNDEEKRFYDTILSSEIELKYDKINTSYFENNEDLMLTIEDISNLSIILSETK